MNSIVTPGKFKEIILPIEQKLSYLFFRRLQTSAFSLIFLELECKLPRLSTYIAREIKGK